MRIVHHDIGKPHGLMPPSYVEHHDSPPEDGDSEAKDLGQGNKACTLYSYNRFNKD